MKVGEGGGGGRNGDIFQTSISFLCFGFALVDIDIGMDRKAAAVVKSVGLVRDVGMARDEKGLEDILADKGAFSVDGADVLRDVGGEAFIDGVGRRRSHVGQEGSDDGTEGYLLEKGVRVGGREYRHRNRNGVVVGSEGGRLWGRRWRGGGKSLGGGGRKLWHGRRQGKAKGQREEGEERSEQGVEYNKYRSHVTKDGLTKDCVL